MSAPSDHALFLALTLALAIASPAAAQKRTSAQPKAEVHGSDQLNWEAERRRPAGFIKPCQSTPGSQVMFILTRFRHFNLRSGVGVGPLPQDWLKASKWSSSFIRPERSIY